MSLTLEQCREVWNWLHGGPQTWTVFQFQGYLETLRYPLPVELTYDDREPGSALGG